MTANTAAFLQPQLPFKVGFIVLLAMLVLLATVVIPSFHADIKRGDIAVAIRKCLDDNNPHLTWRAKDGINFFRLCQLDDGQWGLQVLIRVRGAWKELTAFVPKDGTWGRVTDYLWRNLATPYKGILP